MRELIILLVIIIAVIAMIWYLRSPRAQTAAKPKSDEVRGIQGNVGTSDLAGSAAAATLPAAAPSRATDTVAGTTDEQAIAHLEEPTAKLTQARHDAERTAARLSSRGETALAIQTAAAASVGRSPQTERASVRRLTRSRETPNRCATIEPDSPTYRATIAEYCFSSVEAAEAAGFSSPRREKPAASTRAPGRRARHGRFPRVRGAAGRRAGRGQVFPTRPKRRWRSRPRRRRMVARSRETERAIVPRPTRSRGTPHRCSTTSQARRRIGRRSPSIASPIARRPGPLDSPRPRSSQRRARSGATWLDGRALT